MSQEERVLISVGESGDGGAFECDGVAMSGPAATAHAVRDANLSDLLPEELSRRRPLATHARL